MSTRTHTLRNSFAGPMFHPAGVVALVLKLDAIWRERRSLEQLDDHILKDIGSTRQEVRAEAKRPAWDAPNRWLS